MLGIAELWAASSPVRDWRLAIVAFLFGIPVVIFWLLLVLDRLLWRHVIGWRRIGFLLVSLPLFGLVWWSTDGRLPAMVPPRSGAAIVYLGVFGSVIGSV